MSDAEISKALQEEADRKGAKTLQAEDEKTKKYDDEKESELEVSAEEKAAKHKRIEKEKERKRLKKEKEEREQKIKDEKAIQEGNEYMKFRQNWIKYQNEQIERDKLKREQDIKAEQDRITLEIEQQRQYELEQQQLAEENERKLKEIEREQETIRQNEEKERLRQQKLQQIQDQFDVEREQEAEVTRQRLQRRKARKREKRKQERIQQLQTHPKPSTTQRSHSLEVRQRAEQSVRDGRQLRQDFEQYQRAKNAQKAEIQTKIERDRQIIAREMAAAEQEIRETSINDLDLLTKMNEEKQFRKKLDKWWKHAISLPGVTPLSADYQRFFELYKEAFRTGIMPPKASISSHTARVIASALQPADQATRTLQPGRAEHAIQSAQQQITQAYQEAEQAVIAAENERKRQEEIAAENERTRQAAIAIEKAIRRQEEENERKKQALDDTAIESYRKFQDSEKWIEDKKITNEQKRNNRKSFLRKLDAWFIRKTLKLDKNSAEYAKIKRLKDEALDNFEQNEIAVIPTLNNIANINNNNDEINMDDANDDEKSNIEIDSDDDEKNDPLFNANKKTAKEIFFEKIDEWWKRNVLNVDVDSDEYETLWRLQNQAIASFVKSGKAVIPPDLVHRVPSNNNSNIIPGLYLHLQDRQGNQVPIRVSNVPRVNYGNRNIVPGIYLHLQNRDGNSEPVRISRNETNNNNDNSNVVPGLYLHLQNRQGNLPPVRIGNDAFNAEEIAIFEAAENLPTIRSGAYDNIDDNLQSVVFNQPLSDNVRHLLNAKMRVDASIYDRLKQKKREKKISNKNEISTDDILKHRPTRKNATAKLQQTTADVLKRMKSAERGRKRSRGKGKIKNKDEMERHISKIRRSSYDNVLKKMTQRINEAKNLAKLKQRGTKLNKAIKQRLHGPTARKPTRRKLTNEERKWIHEQNVNFYDELAPWQKNVIKYYYNQRTNQRQLKRDLGALRRPQKIYGDRRRDTSIERKQSAHSGVLKWQYERVNKNPSKRKIAKDTRKKVARPAPQRSLNDTTIIVDSIPAMFAAFGQSNRGLATSMSESVGQGSRPGGQNIATGQSIRIPLGGTGNNYRGTDADGSQWIV